MTFLNSGAVMDVPCCGKLYFLVKDAVEKAGKMFLSGRLLSE